MLGKLGSTLAKNLSKYSDNEITVIDSDNRQLKNLSRSLDIKTICGFATHTNALEDADIEDIDLLVAVTASDESNMIACQIAHTLYGVEVKIARIRSYNYLHRKELFSDTAIPIDFVITPEILVTMFYNAHN